MKYIFMWLGVLCLTAYEAQASEKSWSESESLAIRDLYPSDIPKKVHRMPAIPEEDEESARYKEEGLNTESEIKISCAETDIKAIDEGHIYGFPHAPRSPVAYLKEGLGDFIQQNGDKLTDKRYGFFEPPWPHLIQEALSALEVGNFYHAWGVASNLRDPYLQCHILLQKIKNVDFYFKSWEPSFSMQLPFQLPGRPPFLLPDEVLPKVLTQYASYQLYILDHFPESEIVSSCRNSYVAFKAWGLFYSGMACLCASDIKTAEGHFKKAIATAAKSLDRHLLEILFHYLPA